MSCFIPEYIKEQNLQNKKCEKKLKAYNDELNKAIKLLLLGTAEAGKSTFIRQMRILYKDGYTDKERRTQIELIHQNIFNSMQSMIQAMQQLDIEYDKEENATVNAILIMGVAGENATYLEDPYLTAIKALWSDAGIQECYKRRAQYQLNDSTNYYLTDIDRIAQADYIPTNQDILRVRVPTVGLVEYFFKIKDRDFCMIDVGGQRSQRRKWMHCFDNTRAVIFLVAISEYDQVLMEFDNRNRLRESKTVFDSISKWFKDTPIILFLNKTDLLVEKIENSHIEDYFPEFTGPRQNVEAAKTFFKDMFTESRPKNKTYFHFTCATDTENIAVVFKAVRDIILKSRLDGIGLL